MAQFSQAKTLEALRTARSRIRNMLDGFDWTSHEQMHSLASLFLNTRPDPPRIEVRALRPEIYAPGEAVREKLKSHFDDDPIEVEDTNDHEHEADITFEEGIAIAPLISPVNEIPPTLPPTAFNKTIFRAGDPCFHATLGSGHGTIGAVIRGFQYACAVGIGDFDVSFTKGGLISNNHVIAVSDLGSAGDPIRASRYYDNIATLQGFAPLNDTNIHVDLAVAALGAGVHPMSVPGVWGAIRGVPMKSISGFANVPPFGTNLFKSGASSDVTGKPRDLGPGLINVRGRDFDDVYMIKEGFGTYGDSGSVVLQEKSGSLTEMEIVGMLSWGDSTANVYDDMTTYFWPFIGAGFNASWTLTWSIDGTKTWRWDPATGGPVEI